MSAFPAVSVIAAFSAGATVSVSASLADFRPCPRWRLRGLPSFHGAGRCLTSEPVAGGAASKYQMLELLRGSQLWTGKKFFVGG